MCIYFVCVQYSYFFPSNRTDSHSPTLCHHTIRISNQSVSQQSDSARILFFKVVLRSAYHNIITCFCSYIINKFTCMPACSHSLCVVLYMPFAYLYTIIIQYIQCYYSLSLSLGSFDLRLLLPQAVRVTTVLNSSGRQACASLSFV